MEMMMRERRNRVGLEELEEALETVEIARSELPQAEGLAHLRLLKASLGIAGALELLRAAQRRVTPDDAALLQETTAVRVLLERKTEQFSAALDEEPGVSARRCHSLVTAGSRPVVRSMTTENNRVGGQPLEDFEPELVRTTVRRKTFRPPTRRGDRRRE